jgi:DNA replication protein DnaC
MTAATITDRSALGTALRQLNLSGMLGTLDARLAQARAGELGHLDFLQVLCQDEISRRETTSLQRRIRAARFETPATLEGFDFAASPKLPAAQIRDLAALRWLQSGESVILYGPVGAGKSHVAQALAHLAIRSGADARWAATSPAHTSAARQATTAAMAVSAAARSRSPAPPRKASLSTPASMRRAATS